MSKGGVQIGKAARSREIISPGSLRYIVKPNIEALFCYWRQAA